MLKLIQSTLFGLAGLAILSQSPTVLAQTIPAEPRSSRIPGNISGDIISDEPYFGFFTEALTKYFADEAHITNTTTKLQANMPGGTLNITFQTRTIAQIDGKFRAAINFPSVNASAERSMTIVSDGKSVWSYRSDLNQYSVMPYKQYMASSDKLFIGFSTLGFVNVPTDMRPLLAKGLLNNPTATKEFRRGMESKNVSIIGSIEENDQRSFYVYNFNQPDLNTLFSVWVDPQDKNFKGVKVKVQVKGMDVEMTETLTEREVRSTALPDKTFKFEIPAKATRVQSVSFF
jgi:outer membrane lipoprotein-sorting protein